MATYTNIYPTLKALDAANTGALVAAAAQAFQWDAAGLARFCKLVQADPVEVAGIIATARAAKDAGTPWFVQP